MPARSDCSIAYCAGLYEGEGTIGAQTGYTDRNGVRGTRQTPQIALRISMTDLRPLQKFKSTFGGRITPIKHNNENHKQLYMLIVCNIDEVTYAVSEMYEYLSPRRRKQIDKVMKLRGVVIAR